MATVEIRVSDENQERFEELVSASGYYGDYNSAERVYIFEEENAPDALAEECGFEISIRITD